MSELPRLRLANDGSYVHEDAKPVGTVSAPGGGRELVYLSDEHAEPVRKHVARVEKELEAERKEEQAKAEEAERERAALVSPPNVEELPTPELSALSAVGRDQARQRAWELEQARASAQAESKKAAEAEAKADRKAAK